jgi:hypothetical protein
MMAELGAAYSLQKNVTPILVGVSVDDLPPLLRELPYIKYAELDDYLSQFKQRITVFSKIPHRQLHTN